jgi:hypothetical protein
MLFCDILLMRWRAPMASIYKRNNVYCIKFYQNGRRVRKSLGTKKRTEALKIKEQIERELAAGKYSLEEVDTDVETFWNEYWAWAQDHKRPKTLEVEDLFWRQFTQFAKPKKLGDVTGRDVEKFKAKRRRDGLKPQSINNALRHLQAIYNYAKKLGYYSGTIRLSVLLGSSSKKISPNFSTRSRSKKF